MAGAKRPAATVSDHVWDLEGISLRGFLTFVAGRGNETQRLDMELFSGRELVPYHATETQQPDTE